ncbi:hypothetical protein DIE16_32130 [Burkholderia sp. Bp9090]|nr:hypothetical protein DIE16_32130 [Burkholderia sp. Bp9090]
MRLFSQFEIITSSLGPAPDEDRYALKHSRNLHQTDRTLVLNGGVSVVFGRRVALPAVHHTVVAWNSIRPIRVVPQLVPAVEQIPAPLGASFSKYITQSGDTVTFRSPHYISAKSRLSSARSSRRALTSVLSSFEKCAMWTAMQEAQKH